MIDGILLLEQNLGITFEWFFCLLLLFGGLIFYIKNFQLGIVMHVITFSLTFMWFFAWDQTATTINWAIPAYLMLISIVILAFSLYPARGQNVGVT